MFSIYFLVFVISVFASLSNQGATSTDGEPVYFTPFIKELKINDAKLLSQVFCHERAIGFSGFITVNATNNSQMFFSYYPSPISQKETPLIVWLQGAPERSSLQSLIMPFKDSAKRFQDYDVLFVDNFIGVGFSYGSSDEGSSSDLIYNANNLYQFLRQFFMLSPNQIDHDFYIFGESYAGKIIPVIMNKIYESDTVGIMPNLKGAAIGSGFIDPVNQISYADYFYSFGLIDLNGVKQLKDLEKKCIDHINNENWIEASDVFDENFEMFFNLSDFKQLNYALEAEEDSINLTELLNAFFKFIRVKNLKFNERLPLNDQVKTDRLKSVADDLSKALSRYRIILFAGQYDLLTPYPAMDKMLNNLKFSSLVEWRASKKDIWIVDAGIAGFSRTAGNLTQVMVYNAGHAPSNYQPERVFDIIKRLTTNMGLV